MIKTSSLNLVVFLVCRLIIIYYSTRLLSYSNTNVCCTYTVCAIEVIISSCLILAIFLVSRFLIIYYSIRLLSYSNTNVCCTYTVCDIVVIITSCPILAIFLVSRFLIIYYSIRHILVYTSTNVCCIIMYSSFCCRTALLSPLHFFSRQIFYRQIPCQILSAT